MTKLSTSFHLGKNLRSFYAKRNSEKYRLIGGRVNSTVKIIVFTLAVWNDFELNSNILSVRLFAKNIKINVSNIENKRRHFRWRYDKKHHVLVEELKKKFYRPRVRSGIKQGWGVREALTSVRYMYTTSNVFDQLNVVISMRENRLGNKRRFLYTLGETY